MTEFELLSKLLKSDRSVRRFDQSRKIDRATLADLVELTRFCSSGRNLQPLRYRIVADSEECARMFPALAWAGYYKDWDGPAEGERPVAYLVQCLDTELAANCLCDDGLQLHAITLGATAKGISGCIIKAFNKSVLSEALALDKRYEPRYVLALGYAAETVRLIDMQPGDDFKYYRDENSVHYVPKRPLSELIIG